MLEKLKSKETWKPFAIIFLLSLVITLITLVFACGQEGVRSPIFKSYLGDPLLIMMNFLPIFIAFLLIYALSGRVWVGFLTTSIIFFLLSVVEKYKLLFREEPFVIPEIALIRESAMMKDHYDISLFGSDPLAIFAVVAIVAITVLLFKRYPMPWKGKRRWQFFGSVLALSLVLFHGFDGLYFTPKVYAQVGNEDVINVYNRTEEYMSKGFVYPFLFSGRMLIGDKPEDYDKKLAGMLWNDYKETAIPEDKKVHVVSVMLESFSDFSAFDGMSIDPDVYRCLHEIQGEAVHGNLVTDVFGGGTVNTERAFLTGYSGANHSGTATLLKDVSSHVRYFKDNGYVTEALHPIYGWFYNRKNVNPRLGFDEYLCYENYFKPIEEATGDDKWGYTRDEHFFPEVEKRLNRVASEGNYYFSYALTYQGHGPYADYNQADGRYIEPIEGKSMQDWAIANNYLSLINDTDKAMGEFVESLRQNQAPIVLVFYGDHKPWLGENDSAYHTYGINTDQSTIDGNLNYYTTPYVIWANPAAKAKLGLDFEGEGPDLSPFLLMKYLFEYMDWPLDAMMQVQNDYLKDATVFHTPLLRDGKGYRHIDGDPELLEMIRQYRCMEYYRKNEEIN
ncbi:MAG: LTA synthase family protein [Peptoniphilus sp.]|nr:LTA synthase family protein [Peptoniphilus sp.]MDD7363423.1 LTA synthase family protein [Bacillota bacterium]MDY6044425.1 LTA synthase family protein [Peptoniphilus sp.]